MQSEFIDFKDLDEQGPRQYRVEFSLDVNDLQRDDVDSVGISEVDVQARKGDLPAEYVVEGEVKYQLDLRCWRCDDPAPFANSASFTVRYRPLPPGSVQPVEVELADEELDTEFYSERRIPLRQIAVDQIQLSLPMKPLCDEACHGLCPKCGTNLNGGSCSCEDNVFDDRWSTLKDLRDQMTKKKDV